MNGDRIRRAYDLMLEAFGPQRWWPSETTFETALGAILTQGTAWDNAARAVANLSEAGVLSPEAVCATDLAELERLVRPAGFHRRKARTIRGLAGEAGCSEAGWRTLLALDHERLRARLLGLHGVGPETADAISVYAAGNAVFVADAYARRFAVRHLLAGPGTGYEALQRLFSDSLPADPALMGECHALIVRLCKQFCRATPLCLTCPLRGELPESTQPHSKGGSHR